MLWDDALRMASKREHLEIVKHLVDMGANKNFINRVLCEASQYGQLKIVKCLVENGADVHAYDDCAFHIASEYARFEIVQYLRSISIFKSKPDPISCPHCCNKSAFYSLTLDSIIR